MAEKWRDIPEVKEWMRLVMNQTCACCGKAKTEDFHHKWPKSREGYPGDSVHEPANLVPVCMDCHSKWDDAMGKKPSPMRSKWTSQAKSLDRLYKRWPKRKWRALAPDWIAEAHTEWWFSFANHTKPYWEES